MAIAVDKSGRVWFTESNVSKLGQFDPTNCTFREYPVPGVGDMWGLIVDQKDAVWFTQYSGKGSVNPGGAVTGGGEGRLVRFNPADGNFTFVNIPTVGSFPLRLVADAENRIWFTELLGNRIGVYDPLADQLTEYVVPTNSSGPADLTIDKSGVIWFTETYSRKITKFYPQNRSFVEYPVNAEDSARLISSPVGIAVAQDGRIWFTDHGGNWIARLDPLSGDLAKYPTHIPPTDVYPISIPNGLLIDNEGRVWFVEHGGNSVGYYERDSHTLVEFRIPTGPISTALWIALAPNGNVWFTEWTANKIGFVHADLPIPVSLSVPENDLMLQAGEQRSISFALASSQAIGGNGTLTYSWSSYTPEDIAVGFTPAYPQLEANVPIQAQLALSNRLYPGNYTLRIGIDLGDVIVSSMIETTVSSAQPAPLTVFSDRLALGVAIVGLIGVVTAIVVRRRARRTL